MIAKSILLNNRFTYLSLSILLLSIVAMQYLNAPLVNEICQGGIISYELAQELSITKDILDSWDVQTKTMAGIGLGFDYLFLLIYSSFIALLLFRINEKLWIDTSIYYVGQILIYLIYCAALFDMIENFALIQLLIGDLDQLWSSMAYYFAVPKFGIILITISFIIVSWVTLLFKKT